MNAICENITEMIKLAKTKENLGMPSHKILWVDYNDHMYTYQVLNIVELVEITQEFAQHLNDVLERDVAGILLAKDTSATPSACFNEIVCLTKEDITKIEVDILVRSTDKEFSGIGRLDRTVFLVGGLELQQECAKHAPCKEGEVVLTRGYALPAKQVLHAIPPAIYKTDTLQVLRQMYRKIIHMASYLEARSIAISTLGTGILKYPRTNSATIALREIKEFLRFGESNKQSNSIKKIVLIVFSSNNEFIYKSLLPAYFPPNALSIDDREREHIRRSGSAKQSASNARPLEPTKEDTLIVFESHARGCPTCRNIPELYSEGRDFCDDGYRFAAQGLQHLHMRADQSVHQLRTVEDFPQEMDIPVVFPLSLELL
ncbi:hypothetical protein PMIN02_000550 [Paraphaeosphaeria minitans]